MKTRNVIIGGALVAAGVVLAMRKCRTIPRGVEAVKPFDSKKYLGTWYEIARLDFSHEKCMSNVTAAYSLNPDGSIKVVNRGYDNKCNAWKESQGKAKFVGSCNEAKLKVSFFGPFYAGYNVVDIDEDYKHALVVGRNHDYMWILSRENTIPEEIKQRFLRLAREIGYDTSKLVWTEHK